MSTIFDVHLPSAPKSLASACIDGNINLVKRLLRKGRDPAIPDNKGWTSVHLAAFHQKTEILQVLLKSKKSNAERKHLVNLESWQRETPLIAACKQRSGASLGVVKILIKNGANVNIVSIDGESALHFACSYKNNLKIVKFLLQCGAKINAQEEVNMDSPLHYAIGVAKDNALITYLINRADVHIKNNVEQTPLILAAVLKDLTTVRKIINKFRDSINEEAGPHNALTIACSLGQLDMVEFLIEAGASTNLLVSNFLPIHHAIAYPEIFKKLLPLTRPEQFMYNTFVAKTITKFSEDEGIKWVPSLEALLQFEAEEIPAKTTPLLFTADTLVLHGITKNITCGNAYRYLATYFKYFLSFDANDIFRSIMSYKRISELVYYQNYIWFLSTVGISKTSEHMRNCVRAVRKNLSKFIINPALYNIYTDWEVGDKEGCKRIVELLGKPVLSLKQMCRPVARKYIRSSVENDWVAYLLIKNSSLPKEIKDYLWCVDGLSTQPNLK